MKSVIRGVANRALEVVGIHRDDHYPKLNNTSTTTGANGLEEPEHDWNQKTVFIEENPDGKNGSYFKELKVELKECVDAQCADIFWKTAGDKELEQLFIKIRYHGEDTNIVEKSLNISKTNFKTNPLIPLQEYNVVLMAKFRHGSKWKTATITFYTSPKVSLDYFVKPSGDRIYHTWADCGVQNYYALLLHEGISLWGGYTNVNGCWHPADEKYSGKKCMMKIYALGNENGQISCAEYERVLGGSSTPHSVKATLHLNNPRCIDVKWSVSEDDDRTYIVKSYIQGKKECVDCKTVEGTEMEFENLSQDTEYHFTVQAKKDHDTLAAFSNVLKTLTIPRKHFDIVKKGTPMVKSSYTDLENGKRCTLSISYPDIKEEKLNFLLEEIAIHVDELPQDMKDFPETFSLNIPWGKQHSIRISLFYKDLDTLAVYTSYTVIQAKAGIYGIKILNVEPVDNEIIVRWTGGDGSKKFSILCKDDNSQLLQPATTSENRECKIAMTNSLSYGKHCQITVAATEDLTVCDCKNILIGGDYVISKFTLSKGKNPRRSVVAEWKEPNKIPSEKKISLYYMEGKQRKHFCTTTLSPNATKHYFPRLISSTEYECEVELTYTNSKICCKSNKISTEQNIETVTEKSSSFGKVTDIKLSVIEEQNQGKSSAKLSWLAPVLGENHLIQQFVYTVESVGKLYNSKVDGDTIQIPPEQDSNQNLVTVQNIEHGKEYEVTVKTVFIHLDKQKSKDSNNVSISKKFDIELGKPVYLKAIWKNETITFYWKKVIGADGYKLVLKSRTKNKLLELQTRNCKHKMQMTNDICIGRECFVKIYAKKDDISSESDLNIQPIGEEDVPRLVTASTNLDNPQRCIDVKFDRVTCETTPLAYDIECKPLNGGQSRVIKRINQRDFTADYLMSNTEYRIYVRAIYSSSREQEKRSEGSMSKTIKTSAKSSKHTGRGSFVSPVDSPNSYLHVQNSTMANTYNELSVDQDFDVVKNLKYVLVSQGETFDKYFVEFNPPQFKGNAGDYWIMKFSLTITNNARCNHEQDIEYSLRVFKYKSNHFNLDHGYNFDATVKTVYKIIDSNYELKTSKEASTSMDTRPEAPKIVTNDWTNDSLRVDYHSCRGAVQLRIEVTEQLTQEVIFKEEATGNTWIKSYGDKLGFGKRYKVTLVAIGSGQQENSTVFGWKTIGGLYIPQNPEAKNDDEEPNTKAFVKWMTPENGEPENGYRVTGKLMTGSDFDKTIFEETTKQMSVLASNLPAGRTIKFMIQALYNSRTIDGCWTDSIKTVPIPVQVQNVKVYTDHEDPACSVIVDFDPVDAAKLDEETIYQVKCEESNGKSVSIANRGEHIKVPGLQPGTKYAVTVRAGNSYRFGKESDEKQITTNLGTVKNVKVSLDEKSPHTAMIVRFQAAEGSPVNYIIKVTQFPNESFGDLIWIGANQMEKPIENLEANRKYKVGITAVYRQQVEGNVVENEGDPVDSEFILTAPAQAEIDYVKLSENDNCCIHVKWNHVEGCNDHEVIFKQGDKEEATLAVSKQIFYNYKCKAEASEYSVQLRSKNESGYFGSYSSEKLITLAPKKVTDLKVELVKSKVEMEVENAMHQGIKKVRVSWKLPAEDVAGFYVNEYMENELVNQKHRIDSRQLSYIITNTQPSKKYYVEVWAFNSEDTEGPKEKSATITSEPPKGEIEELKTDDTIQNLFIVSWIQQEGCETHIEITEMGGEGSNLVLHEETKSLTTYMGTFGSKYFVRIRKEYQHQLGEWSEPKCIQLVPDKVKKIDLDLQEYKLSAKWPDVKGAKEYVGKLISTDGKNTDVVVEETELKENRYISRPLKPGMVYRLEVTAQNTTGKAEATLSDEIRTKWQKPKNFVATPDPENPSAKAMLSWDRPYGVNCCRLVVDGQTWTEIECDVSKQSESYRFIRNKPGEECDIRLQCGRDGVYDPSLIAPQTPLIFAPNPPKCVELVPEPEKPQNLILRFQEPDGSMPECYDFSIFKGETVVKENVHLKELRYTVVGLKPNTEYFATVRSYSLNKDCPSKKAQSSPMKTCPSQVQNLRVESVNFKTRKLLWDSLNPTPDCYKICHWINDETRKDEVLNKSHFIIENFKPGYSYFFKVAAVNSSGPGCFSITKEYTENPAPPRNLFAQRDSKNPTSAINVQLVEAYTDYPNKPDIYFIQCENVDTKQIKTLRTRREPVVFESLSPGSVYQFLCWAETNGIPSKETKAEKSVRTALSPPLHIEAQVDRDKPSTEINVVITKADKQAGYYVIILTSESDKGEHPKRVDEDQVKFDDLKPGETYSIKGHAELHKDKAVTSSTLICDKTVQTYPPVCKRPEKYDERHNHTRFYWEASAFPVKGYHISFSHDNSEDTYFTTNTYYDHMLECGQEYSVKVAFENNAGIGRFSEPLQFITKPSTPTITCWESKSKKEVLISCTASRRANKYIFKIKPKHLSPDEEELEEIKIPSGKPSLKLPLEHLDCVDYSISVIAANEAGNSDPSPPVWHKHYFNYIQDQMKKQVAKKYNEKQHVSANWENLFGETQEDLNAFLNLNAGQSVMLLGSLGSGKTQACFHYLMKTEFDEMVFYVDKVAFDSWNEISITGLLKELFPKLLRAGNNNRELLKFMDDNSNKLIFVIDNLSLANSNYTGCTYDDKVSVDCLFYNLVKEKRSLFTDSRVVFTSNTKSVYDAMNPTKICQLKGLQKEAIVKSVHRECKFLDHEAVEKAREYLSTPIIHELCTYPPAFTAFIKYMSSENSELTAAGLVSYMLHHEIVKKNELEEKDYSQLKQMWEEVGRVSALIAVKTKHTVELNSTDVYSKILVAMYIVLSQDYESFKLYLAAQCENPNLDPLIFQLVLGFLNANAPITIAKVFSQAEILPSTAVFETKSIKVPSYIKKKKDQINKRIKEGIIPKELWSTCLAELDNDKLSQSFASLNVSG